MVNLKKLCVGALLATTICGMGALTPSAEAGKIEDVQLAVFCWLAVPATTSL